MSEPPSGITREIYSTVGRLNSLLQKAALIHGLIIIWDAVDVTTFEMRGKCPHFNITISKEVELEDI